jgi:hypothetical protein
MFEKNILALYLVLIHTFHTYGYAQTLLNTNEITHNDDHERFTEYIKIIVATKFMLDDNKNKEKIC